MPPRETTRQCAAPAGYILKGSGPALETIASNLPDRLNQRNLIDLQFHVKGDAFGVQPLRQTA